jgi:hypothetical protein
MLGDGVLVTVPGMYRERPGMVVEVIQPRSGDVYRYRVRFTDGTTASFFGFELEINPDSLDNARIRDAS